MNSKNIRIVCVCLGIAIFTGWHFHVSQQKKIEIEKKEQVAQEEKLQFINAKKSFSDISVSAKSAYVVDLTNNEILYEKDAYTPYGIASLTKLMTADIAIRSHDVGESITISKQALSTLGTTNLMEGDILKVSDLVILMLTSSSNDAASALSENDPLFISKMNGRARQLGMYSFVFESVTGLDHNQNVSAVGSAHDVSTLISYFRNEYPQISQKTNMYNFESETFQGRRIAVLNTNILLSSSTPIIASKTGYTDRSGGSLAVIIQTQEGREIAIVVLGSTFGGRFMDTSLLIEKAIQYSQKLGSVK